MLYVGFSHILFVHDYCMYVCIFLLSFLQATYVRTYVVVIRITHSRQIIYKTTYKDYLSVATNVGFSTAQLSDTYARLYIGTTCLHRSPPLGPLSGCYRQVLLYSHFFYWEILKKCIFNNNNNNNNNNFLF